MKNTALRNVMFAAALGGAMPLLDGCTTINEFNPNSCTVTTGFHADRNLPAVAQVFVPGVVHARPSTPCIASLGFMSIVDTALAPRNHNNYQAQGDVVSRYQRLQADSTTSRDAAETLYLVDHRLEAQGLTIQQFIDSYNANKPQVVSETREGSCTSRVLIQNGGQRITDRICSGAPAAPAGQTPPQP